jgi:beta-galactosidase
MTTSGWTRGVVWLNGNNLGRLWTTAGPQQTLFVPKSFLQPGKNEVVVLEFEAARGGPTELISAPNFSGPVI